MLACFQCIPYSSYLISLLTELPFKECKPTTFVIPFLLSSSPLVDCQRHHVYVYHTLLYMCNLSHHHCVLRPPPRHHTIHQTSPHHHCVLQPPPRHRHIHHTVLTACQGAEVVRVCGGRAGRWVGAALRALVRTQWAHKDMTKEDAAKWVAENKEMLMTI